MPPQLETFGRTSKAKYTFMSGWHVLQVTLHAEGQYTSSEIREKTAFMSQWPLGNSANLPFWAPKAAGLHLDTVPNIFFSATLRSYDTQSLSNDKSGWRRHLAVPATCETEAWLTPSLLSWRQKPLNSWATTLASAMALPAPMGGSPRGANHGRDEAGNGGPEKRSKQGRGTSRAAGPQPDQMGQWWGRDIRATSGTEMLWGRLEPIIPWRMLGSSESQGRQKNKANSSALFRVFR